MSGCPHDIPAIRVSTGNSGELDLITPSYGFIRYDTTHHNLEVYEENGWKDIVINDKTNIDISGKIIVNDVSINSNLLAVDASFSNIGGIDGSLIVLGDLSVTGNIYTSDGFFSTGGGGGGGGGSGTDVSFNNIQEYTPNSGITFLSDVSFNNSIDVSDSIITKKLIGDYINIISSENKTFVVDFSQNFTLGGLVQPTLNLYRGSVYKFDQSDPDNVGQRLYVSNDLDGGQRGVVGNKLPDVAMTSNDTTDCETSVSSQYSDSRSF